MVKALFLTHPTIGHLNTLLTIALKMREDGHQVHFLVPGLSNIPYQIGSARIAPCN